jgi:hypothetical protein
VKLLVFALDVGETALVGRVDVIDCMRSCGRDLERSYDHDLGRLDDEYAAVGRGVDRHGAHGDWDAR